MNSNDYFEKMDKIVLDKSKFKEVPINPIPFGLFFVLILSGGGQICPPLEFMYKIDKISFYA